MPPGYDGRGVRWFRHLNPYLGRSPDGAFGFGNDYMCCPSQPSDAYRTYGINYSMTKRLGHAWYYNWDNDEVESHRLAETDPAGFQVTDAHCVDWGHGDYNRDGTILWPEQWSWNMDWDHDGLLDSTQGELDTTGPYNAWGPRHRGRGHFVFNDGHVQALSIAQFVTNADGVWGRR